MDINRIAGKIAVILEDKKARDIEILDIKGKTVLADYFVICSGSSETHIRTLCDEVEERLEEEGLACLHKEGYGTARWILMDYGDIVVHIFHKDEREFYNIERLWSDSVMKHRDTPVK